MEMHLGCSRSSQDKNAETYSAHQCHWCNIDMVTGIQVPGSRNWSCIKHRQYSMGQHSILVSHAQLQLEDLIMQDGSLTRSNSPFREQLRKSQEVPWKGITRNMDSIISRLAFPLCF